LGGFNSVIGRSIHVTLKSDESSTPKACCVIGLDKDPKIAAKKKAYQPAYSPGYGFYAGPGVGHSGYGTINFANPHSFGSKGGPGGYNGFGTAGGAGSYGGFGNGQKSYGW